MSRQKSNPYPSYRCHTARGLAKVTVRRVDLYLGKWQSPESYQKYAKVLLLLRSGHGIDQIQAALHGKSVPESEDYETHGQLSVGQLTCENGLQEGNCS